MISSAAISQNCNIGNEDTLGFSNGLGFQAEVLLGVKFKLNSKGSLNSMNLIGNNTGAQVRMALYDDSSGVPNNLISSTAPGLVGTGIISLPVTSVQLDTGDYWVMAVYSAVGAHSYVDRGPNGNPVYYSSLIFSDPMPQNASSFAAYSGDRFTYF